MSHDVAINEQSSVIQTITLFISRYSVAYDLDTTSHWQCRADVTRVKEASHVLCSSDVRNGIWSLSIPIGKEAFVEILFSLVTFKHGPDLFEKLVVEMRTELLGNAIVNL